MTDGDNKQQATAAGLQLLMQNPTLFLIMLFMLGGQGADLLSSNNSRTEFRELRTDVEAALQEITDNSERIGRLEERIAELGVEVRNVQRQSDQIERDTEGQESRLQLCEQAMLGTE